MIPRWKWEQTTPAILGDQESKKTTGQRVTGNGQTIQAMKGDLPYYQVGPYKLPKTLQQAIQSSAQAPAMVGGVISTPAKIGLGVLGGLLGGAFLFGGGGQEQEQEAVVTPTLTPTQEVDVSPTLRSILDLLTHIRTVSQADVQVTGGTVMGSIASPVTTTITAPYTYQPQITETYNIQESLQITHVGQEQRAEQGLDLVKLALIGIIGLIGYGIVK